METAQLIFPEQLKPSVPVQQMNKVQKENIPDEKKVQIAKDFESLLLSNLLEQMKSTIGNWGMEKDSTSNQIDGIFWLYLSREISDNGGLGFWQDIYKNLPNNEQTQDVGQNMDGQV